MTLTNAHIAELMARTAAQAEGHRRRAYARASSAAMMWPEEAASLAANGRELTELRAIGPRLAARISSWLDDPPPLPEPPQLRRDFMTMAEARVLLAVDPLWRDGLRGDLQMHTDFSDGSLPVEEMAVEAAERGYEYVAITDHSKGLKIAGGMDEFALAEQTERIDLLNQRLAAHGNKLSVLRGLELNLDIVGNGDMHPDSLRSLDIVLGSFHSQLRLTDDQTDRYVAALSNPHVHVLAHPRGRKYDRRTGLNADWGRVFETASELDKALEINSYPDRQDLQGELLRMARDAGVRLSIGTDAHHPFELDFVDLSLANALNAGIDRARIVNFQPKEQVLQWTAELKARA